MSPQSFPGNERGAEPPSAESTPGSAPLETGPSNVQVLDLDPQGRYDAAARRPLAAVRGLLGQLVPSRISRSRARQISGPDAAAGEALQATLRLAPVGRLGEGRATMRSGSAPTSGPPTPRVSGRDGPASNLATGPTSRPAPGETLGTSALNLEAVRRAASPALAAGLAPSRSEPEEGPAAHPQSRQPGNTAPDFLLETPTSATLASDDFFDGLVRRVESDR